jgi:hypothetical protein
LFLHILIWLDFNNYNLDIYVFFQSTGTDIADAVVLYANADREAAKEFITNMKKEFPDLDWNNYIIVTYLQDLLTGQGLQLNISVYIQT